MSILIHSIPLWFELFSLACCTGILVSLFLVFDSQAEHNPVNQNRLWLLFIIFSALTMAAGFIDLLQRIAEMSGETILPSFSLIPTVLAKAHSGQVWLVRVVSLAIIFVLSLFRQFRVKRTVLNVLLCLDAIVAFTESASGHAADKGDFTIVEMIDWIHLLGALVWAGGIFVLSTIILPRGSTLNSEAVRVIADHALRFSRLAGFAVSCVVLTALYNAVIYVGSVKALVNTSYGLTIAAKAALLFMLLLLAAYNRYVSVPNLAQQAGLEGVKTSFIARMMRQLLSRNSLQETGGNVLIHFKRAVRFEAILLLGLLLCASCLRHEIPARHALYGDHIGEPIHEHMRH